MHNALSSKLAALDPDSLGVPTRSSPPTNAVIEGLPEFTTWLLSETADGRVSSGVWNSTPGVWHSKKDGWEYCTFLSGSVEISEYGGATRHFKAGDTLVIEPGFRGTWRVIEETRKIFVSYK